MHADIVLIITVITWFVLSYFHRCDLQEINTSIFFFVLPPCLPLVPLAPPPFSSCHLPSSTLSLVPSFNKYFYLRHQAFLWVLTLGVVDSPFGALFSEVRIGHEKKRVFVCRCQWINSNFLLLIWKKNLQTASVLQLFHPMESTTVSTASAIATTLTTKSYDYFDPTVFPGPDDDLDDIDDRWPTWVSLMPGVALLSLTLAVVWFVASRPGARLVEFQRYLGRFTHFSPTYRFICLPIYFFVFLFRPYSYRLSY